mmetsp:Transcript_3663/g.8607  ORF Transcript_3663/g.8607 Transcript_3663/m.8607 type:complete len:335 (-) Transcript_3663:2561-3565(-)
MPTEPPAFAELCSGGSGDSGLSERPDSGMISPDEPPPPGGPRAGSGAIFRFRHAGCENSSDGAPPRLTGRAGGSNLASKDKGSIGAAPAMGAIRPSARPGVSRGAPRLFFFESNLRSALRSADLGSIRLESSVTIGESPAAPQAPPGLAVVPFWARSSAGQSRVAGCKLFRPRTLPLRLRRKSHRFAIWVTRTQAEMSWWAASASWLLMCPTSLSQSRTRALSAPWKRATSPPPCPPTTSPDLRRNSALVRSLRKLRWRGSARFVGYPTPMGSGMSRMSSSMRLALMRPVPSGSSLPHALTNSGSVFSTTRRFDSLNTSNASHNTMTKRFTMTK